MKKVSVIILFLLPVLAFALISVSGIVVNDSKYKKVERVEIVSERIIVNQQTGDKFIVVTETGQIQLGYNVYPEDATEPGVIWEVASGGEYGEINQYGIVRVTALGGTITVKLWDVNRLAFRRCELRRHGRRAHRWLRGGQRRGGSDRYRRHG